MVTPQKRCQPAKTALRCGFLLPKTLKKARRAVTDFKDVRKTSSRCLPVFREFPFSEKMETSQINRFEPSSQLALVTCGILLCRLPLRLSGGCSSLQKVTLRYQLFAAKAHIAKNRIRMESPQFLKKDCGAFLRSERNEKDTKIHRNPKGSGV